MDKKKGESKLMYRLAAFIVEKRYLFLLLYVFAILFCLFP